MKEMGTRFPQQKEVRSNCLVILFKMINCPKKLLIISKLSGNIKTTRDFG